MLEELTVRKAVEFAVKTEEMGGRFYEKFARKFSDDPELKKTFELLARDEKAHENQFLKLLETLPNYRPSTPLPARIGTRWMTYPRMN